MTSLRSGRCGLCERHRGGAISREALLSYANKLIGYEAVFVAVIWQLAFGKVRPTEVKKVWAKTTNGHFCHLGDKDSGKASLDKVSQDTVDIEDDPGHGQGAGGPCDLAASEELHRGDDGHQCYDPDDACSDCRAFLSLCVGVQDGLIVTVEAPLERLLVVNHKECDAKDGTSNEFKDCFCDDLLL